MCCFIFTLIAIVKFFPGVLLDMSFERVSCDAGKVALCALVWFLPAVNDGMGLQNVFSAERLVTLWTAVFDPIVRLLVAEEVAPVRKCFRTFVTR